MADLPDFTVIKCGYGVGGTEDYDYFVKIDGEWVPVGSEYIPRSFDDATKDYANVTIVSGPIAQGCNITPQETASEVHQYDGSTDV